MSSTETLTGKMAEMVRFVGLHASDHMDAGWDVVTETMSTADLVTVIGRSRSLTGAVNVVRSEVVAPFVMQMLETREGTDDDLQLDTARRLQEECAANYNDATAPVSGAPRLSERGVRRELGFWVGPKAAPAPEVTPEQAAAMIAAQQLAADLAKDEVAVVAELMAVPAQGSGRQAPSTKVTRTRRQAKA